MNNLSPIKHPVTLATGLYLNIVICVKSPEFAKLFVKTAHKALPRLASISKLSGFIFKKYQSL